jgi:hypothetical protein
VGRSPESRAQVPELLARERILEITAFDERDTPLLEQRTRRATLRAAGIVEQDQAIVADACQGILRRCRRSMPQSQRARPRRSQKKGRTRLSNGTHTRCRLRSN